MKRKIFSKLLMGAFLIASVSSFVSCKDYDDDINNLQKQIDAAALKAELTSLQQTLAAQIAAAQSAADKAQAAAEAAQKTADNAATKDALEAVKTAAEKAGTDAAAAIAAAANAQFAADAAQTTANSAGTAAEKAAADAAKAIADAAGAQGSADVAAAAAAAAAEAAKVAQAAGDAATANAAKALADAAKAVEAAQAASATSKDALADAKTAGTTSTEAKATAENALAAATNAAAQAAEALAAAQAAKVAAGEATNSNATLAALLEKANKYADDAAAAALKAAEAAQAASEEAADAKTIAQAASDKIDKAIEEATASINKATDAKIAAAVAEIVATQADVDAAQDDALATAVADLTAKLSTLGDKVGACATAEALSESVKGLQEQIEGVVEEATVAAVAAATGTLAAVIDDLYAMITSVELFYWDDDDLGRLNHQNLQFYWAEEVSTWKFGMDLAFGEQKVEVTNTQLTDKTIDFTENLVNISKDSVVIRVVPIKAELTADMIALVNTQGDTISSEFIKVGTPHRLTEKLYRNFTRATDVEVGGLWVVPFEVNKENFTAEIAASNAKIDKSKGEMPIAESFNTEWSDTEKTEGAYNYQKSYLYAVAVKTKQGEVEADSRRLITQHDLTLMPVMAKHAPDFFTVTTKYAVKDSKTGKVSIYDAEKDIDDIHNRFLQTEMEKTYTTKVPEYNYMNPADADKAYNKAYNYPYWYKAYAPADMFVGKTITSREGKSIQVSPKDDNRQNSDDVDDMNMVVLDLDIDNQITIDFSAGRDVNQATNTINSDYRIKAFYVTLDADFALESKASELQAWSTYEYTNSANEKTVAIYDVANRPIEKSGKMFESETGVIVFNVPEEKKAALAGEIIGFRVYAVNYDGTVVNPDGRAFYVQIKKPETPTITADEVNVTIKATKEKGDVSGFVEIPESFREKFVSGGHYSAADPEVLSKIKYFANADDAYREQKTTYKTGDPLTVKEVSDDAEETWEEGEYEQPEDLPFTVKFYNGNGDKAAVVTNLKDAKFLKVTINAEELLDNEKYTIGYNVYDAQNDYESVFDLVAKLKINVTKTVDEGALPEWFGVKPEAIAADGLIHMCLVPSQTNCENTVQAHKNYFGTDPTDYEGQDIANIGWYQVAEVLKGAREDRGDVILSFHNADVFDTWTTQVQNAKTDKVTGKDNDDKNVSTFVYNTEEPGWYDAAGAWTANEWSQWGTTNYMYVFSDPAAAIKAATEKAAKADDPDAALQVELQKIRNSWPAKDTKMAVDAYYDNADGPRISRTVETNVIAGTTTSETTETLYTAAHSVKAKVANWKTFSYSCWHHSANFNLKTIANSCDRIWNDNQAKYVLKENPKQIALSVKYGETLSNYKYWTLGAEQDAINANEPNNTITVAALLDWLIYTNPYLTTNTGKAISDASITKAELDNSINSQASLIKVDEDINGNEYPRVVPSKGFDGTNAELENLTYYKYEGGQLVKQKNVATFVNKVTEYIQYHYVDFFGHDVYVEIPFDILPE